MSLNIRPSVAVSVAVNVGQSILRPQWFGSSGPPGNPLLFVPDDMQDSIGLSTETIALLSTDQQTFFTDTTWATFALFYAAVSAEDWFNAGNVMGDNIKGIAFYPESTSRSSLIRNSSWWPITLNIPFSNIDELTQTEIDAMLQSEIDALPQYGA